ncbi:BCCT family transporter [Kordiimonas aquimaris]|uniref:BCCT family transporter n=1 Tax=Kordiimonas aquimaris TaxID=707591 RepID=UPI0021D2FD45|nr:BCCT family transporter [Kordiimonas aquimaris]
MLNQLRLPVLLVPMFVLVSGVAASLYDLPSFLMFVSGINEWILFHFSDLFNWASFLFVLTCVWVWFSPLGEVKIGGKNAEPLLSKWQWFSITLCTTIAIGILFWASAEPLFHFYEPPAQSGIEPASPAAARFAISSLFMHWSITPYAIYTVPSLAFALAYYNLGKNYSLSGPLSVVWKPLSYRGSRDIFDAIALFALVAGMAATLGVGILSIAGGIGLTFGEATKGYLTAAVAIAIIATFTVSSITGLLRGIRILSDINVRFFFILCGFLLVLGPTGDIFLTGILGIADYAVEFLPRSIGMGATADDGWQRSWTSFYWANWLAWAPITAMFLGRIARGYTVRQFITFNLILPAAFAIVWMSIFGASALGADMAGGALYETLKADGPESVIYALFNTLPYPSVWIVLFVVLSFVCFVTAADSNTEAIANVCQKGPDAHRGTKEQGGPTTNLYMKVIWASLIGITAWTMVTFSGVDGVRMLSNLGGLPGLIIVFLMNIALLKMGTRYLDTISNA